MKKCLLSFWAEGIVVKKLVTPLLLACLTKGNALPLILAIMVAFSCAAPADAWLIYHKGAFKGVIRDSETNAPIEGAVVVAQYQKTLVAGFEPVTSTFDVREAVSDGDGMFEIPSYTGAINPFCTDSFVRFIIYKAGYGSGFVKEPVPASVVPAYQEVFFAKENFRKRKELRMWLEEAPGPEQRRLAVSCGVIYLRPLKTREEREQAAQMANLPLDFPCRKIKHLIRALRDEYQRLGLTGYAHWMEDCK